MSTTIDVEPERNEQRGCEMQPAPASSNTAEKPGINGRLLAQVALVFACFFLFAKPWINGFLPQDHHFVDFHQEWLSGRNFWTGRPIYTPISESLPQHDDRMSDVNAVFNVNAHPPTAVLVALPFALFDDGAAFLAWNCLCLAALLTSVALILRELKIPLSTDLAIVLICGFLLSEPLYVHFVYGQINLMMLPVLTLAWCADRRGLSYQAGALVGLAASLKFFPAFLVVYFLGRRDWRAVCGTVLAFVGANLVAAGVLGLEAYRGYWTLGMPSAAAFRGAFGNVSLPALWTKLFAPTGHHGPAVALADIAWLSPVLAALSVLVIAAAVWRAAGASSPGYNRDRAFALAMAGMLLVSPVTWDHYFVLLLLPLFMLAFNTANSPIRWIAFGCTVPWLWLTTVRLLQGVQRSAFDPLTATAWDTLAIHSWQCYALVTLFVLLLTARPHGAAPSPVSA